MKPHTLYECGICCCVHPWYWNGDCREDANRYSDAEDYAAKKNVSVYDVDVLSWEERVAADVAA